MRHIRLIIPLMALCLLLSCKGEKRVSTYETLYKEQTFTILIAPVQDNAKRFLEKTTQDVVRNEELTAAAYYLRQTLTEPLVSQGYYTLPPLASDVVLEQLGKDYRQLMDGDISELSQKYGIDAVLLVAIHNWQEPEANEIAVYVEYTLRSTKTGMELMHNWVRGNKIQPVDTKGYTVELESDIKFMQQTEMSNDLAHRCILLQQVSDFALRNTPTSANRWYFKHDQYIASNPAYYGFTIGPDGSVERSTYNEDAFGNACFND